MAGVLVYVLYRRGESVIGSAPLVNVSSGRMVQGPFVVDTCETERGCADWDEYRSVIFVGRLFLLAYVGGEPTVIYFGAKDVSIP